jgi:hypothetical protein
LYLPGGPMSITAIIIITFYFAVIFVPLVLVIRESLREISRLESEIQERKERKKTKTA